MTECVHPECKVLALEGCDACSDHLTYSTFLGGDAAENGIKSAARHTGGGQSKIYGLRPGTIGQRIVGYLQASPRVPFTPNEIARDMNLHPGTVSKELIRLQQRKAPNGDPYVTRLQTGAWRSFRDAAMMEKIEAPNVSLHAVQASFRMPLNRGWGPPAGAPPGGFAAWKENGQNGQFATEVFWGAHLMTVAVSPTTGTIQVSLKASDVTISVAGLENFLAFLDGFMAGQRLKWLSDSARVDNIELNWDNKRVALAGARRLSLRVVKNAWAQGYQKDLWRLRRELRFSPDRDETLRWAEMMSNVRELSRPEKVLNIPVEQMKRQGTHQGPADYEVV